MHLHSFSSVLIILAMVSFISSCDKPKKLDAERVKLTTERQMILDEIAAVDDKTAALRKLGLSGDAGEMSRNAASILQEAASVEKTASAKLQKWSQIEIEFNVLRQKAAAYKSKNLR